MAEDEAAARRARSPRPPVPGPNRARRRHPRRVHDRRAPPAVPRQARSRRRDLRGRSRDAHRGRRRIRPRRPGCLRALGSADVLHGLGGRARPRRPPDLVVRAPPAPVARLLRAEPHRRDRQPHHERRRGARPARHRRRVEPRAEHAPARRDRDRPLPARLAPRPGDAPRPPADGGSHRLVPRAVEPGVPPRARAAGARDRDARGGHLGHARRPVVHARALEPHDVPRGQRALPRVELRDGRAQRHLLPHGRRPLVDRDRDRPRLRRRARHRGRHHDRHAPRLHALPRELLRPGAAALAALQHVPLRDRCPRPDHWPSSTRSPTSWTLPDADELPRIDGHVDFDHVRFGYGDLPDVLHDFDLDVAPGTTVALVGHTGAGKSTIAKLLARFYDPRDGRDHDRRPRHPGRDAVVAPPPARDRAAGGIPVRGDDRRQHRIRPARGLARRDRGGGGVRRRRRRSSQSYRRVRHPARGARLPALARPAAARRVRAGAARRPADPHPRRSDLVGRHRRPSGASSTACACSSPDGRPS